MSKKKKARSLSDGELDRLVYEAMLVSGLLPPLNPDDVPIAMAGFDESAVELPPGLLDEEEVLSGRFEAAYPKPAPIKPETVESLKACAAKKGGEITDEVRERMKRDREAAERDSRDERE